MDFMGYKLILQTVSLSLILTFVMGLLPDAGRQRIEDEHGGNSEVADQFEQQLLSMFGLSKRPRPTPGKKIPKIMSHLYRAHMGDASDGPHSLEDSWEVGFDLPHEDVLKTVNTARSFHHLESEENLEGLPENHIRLKFDVSSVPKHETLGAAELLLHRNEIEHHFEVESDHLHRINVYEIVKLSHRPIVVEEEAEGEFASIMELVNRRRNKFKLSKPPKSHPIKRLLDTRLIDVRNSTWERFDVSPATSKWLQDSTNHGLIVEVERATNDGNTLAPGVDKHVRLRRDLHDLSDDEWTDVQPLLMTYSDDKVGSRKETNLSRRRRKRSGGRRRDKDKRKRAKKNCQKKDLYVDFAEVEWNTWIVAPHGYQAHYCEGDCPFPLSDRLNATNHAIVQTLVNSIDSTKVTKVCCVPTELSPISMLYLDEYDLVVLKTYQQMVVDACGCR